MTTTVSTVCQSFCLGLRAYTSCRAAFSTLRTVTSAPKTSVLCCRNPVGSSCQLSQTTWPTFSSCCPASFTPNTSTSCLTLKNQSRWVSIWRPASERPETNDATTAPNEIVVSPSDVKAIFGRKMEPQRGVEILMALQKHRVEGTLDYKKPYADVLVAKGLDWLRKHNSLDEDAAIIARVDRETVGSGAYARHYVSQFDKMREEQKKRNLIEEKKPDADKHHNSRQSSRETSKKMAVKSNSQTSPSNEVVGLRPEPAWVTKYREEATNRDESVKYLLSTWQRLLPSAAMTIGVIALSILFAANYTPPSRSARIWPEIPPAAATVLALIGMNCVVFLLWRIPPLWKFMNKNFLVAPVYPYAMSMLGASFSQQKFAHLFANCFAIWLIGPHGTHSSMY